MSRSSREGRIRGLRALALIGVLLAPVSCSPPAEPPPLPRDLAEFDPELIELVEVRAREVEDAPSRASTWLALGEVYEANGVPTLAQTCYEESVELDHGIAKAWYRLSLVRARNDDRVGALEAMASASGLAPDYAHAHWHIGYWRLDLGEVDRARQAFQIALDLDPENVAAKFGLARADLEDGDHESAAARLEPLASADVSEATRAYARLLLGRAYARMGRSDEAGVLLEQGAGGSPGFVDPWRDEIAHLRRGYAARRKDARSLMLAGEHQRALHVLEELRSRRPEDVTVLLDLATCYRLFRRPGDARRALEQARTADPDNTAVLVELARGAMARGEVEAALVDLSVALERDPENAAAHALHADILMSQRRFEEALASFDDALRIDGDVGRCLLGRGMALLELARFEDALVSLGRATRFEDTACGAWVGKGLALEALGRMDEAGAAFDEAERLDPQDPYLRQVRRRPR